MTQQGFLSLTVLDNQGAGLVTVPSSSVQLVVGPSSAGTPNTPFATRSQATIVQQIGYGPLLEAALFAINGGGNGLPGGTVIVCKTTINAKGALVGTTIPAATVLSVANGPPAVLTTTAAHGLITGTIVVVAGATGDTAINGTWVITVISPTTFSIPVTGTGSYTASSGTATSTGVISTATGTLVPTITLDSTNGSFDDYLCQLTWTSAGTIGTAGAAFTLSLDANRNTGPIIQLGTATSYAIPNTGITLNFTSTQTVVAGDFIRFATTMPTWSDSGILAAFQAVQASPFANAGWGGGTLILGPAAGADASTIEGYLDNTLAAGYLFTRAMVATRDAKIPQAWGGVGETATAWSTAIMTDYSAVSAKRICACAGNYNMPSGSQAQGPAVPSVTYRRNLSWAIAARQVSIPPQRSAGRVRDASLQNIVINPAIDPTDGFVYWDERTQGGTLTAARFGAATTRIPNLPGYFVLVGPNLMSPSGSQFVILPQGRVIDEAASLFVQSAQEEINEDVLTNIADGSGTLTPLQISQIEADILEPITINMVNTGFIQGALVVVDPNNDVQTTMNLNVACVILARGYVETVTATIALAAA
jgi:hypothetical protein